MVAKYWMLAALLCACADKPPTPLYPDPGRALAPHEVAILVGDVRDVDSKVVSKHGGRFALLPGCHTVGLVETWGRLDLQSNGIVANLPRIVYAMPMQGGYSYIVRIDADYSGARGHVNITAQEQDGDGNVTQEFSPASPQAIADCRS